MKNFSELVGSAGIRHIFPFKYIWQFVLKRYFQRLHFLSHIFISIDRKKISEILFLVNFVKFWAIMHFEKLSEYRRLSFPDIDTASPERYIPTKHGLTSNQSRQIVFLLSCSIYSTQCDLFGFCSLVFSILSRGLH